jgi:hypothetical protein
LTEKAMIEGMDEVLNRELTPDHPGHIPIDVVPEMLRSW